MFLDPLNNVLRIYKFKLAYTLIPISNLPVDIITNSGLFY